MRVVIDHRVPCSKIRVHIQSMSYLSWKKVTDMCDTAKLLQSFHRECKLHGQHILSALLFNALKKAPVLLLSKNLPLQTADCPVK